MVGLRPSELGLIFFALPLVEAWEALGQIRGSAETRRRGPAGARMAGCNSTYINHALISWDLPAHRPPFTRRLRHSRVAGTVKRLRCLDWDPLRTEKSSAKQRMAGSV